MICDPSNAADWFSSLLTHFNLANSGDILKNWEKEIKIKSNIVWHEGQGLHLYLKAYCSGQRSKMDLKFREYMRTKYGSTEGIMKELAVLSEKPEFSKSFPVVYKD